MAEIVEFILRDSRLPLQGINPPESLEWSFPLEDPILSAGSLSYAADRLIGRCCEHARRVGKHVRSIRFFLEGTAAHQELVLRPSLPTREVNLLSRLFASRLEYISLDDPVRNLSCTGSLAGALTPQGTLFGGETRGRWFEAQKVLSSLQAERGEEFVQYARVLENPLPMRRFELCNWKGFCERPAARSAGRRESSHPVSSGFFLSRRIVLEPKSFRKGIRTISRVAYSGGWWDQPYSYEMAWAESGGRTCWLSADSGRRPWKLIGWLD
jgi:hypothetical protein